jgi:PadR family transcriptional regulator, regulatory protein PadR
MADGLRLSHTSAMILQAIAAGHIYGYMAIAATGLASGTVYPALRRLEQDGLIRSEWESQAKSDAAQRPPRKYYALTKAGDLALDAARKRYPLLASLESSEEVDR